jgi:hypothetical protein
MRKHRIAVLVVLMIVVTVAAGFYAGHRPSAIAMPAQVSPVSPPPTEIAVGSPHQKPVVRKKLTNGAASAGTSAPAAAGLPLKDIFADLKARADANDPAAATELYRDLGRCQYERDMARLLPKILPSVLDRDTSKDSLETLKNRDGMLQNMQKELDFVQRNQAFCADLDNATLQQYVPSALKAAQLGDPRAARCYLGGAVERTSGLLDHPEWLSDFKQNAMSLADQGIQQGDWGIAALLGHAYGGLFSSSFLTQVTGTDPVKAYQYLKLQRLGANGDFVSNLDSQLATASADLTPDQIAQGDAWAQQTYTQYYSGSASNELSNGVNTCGNFDAD